MVAIITRSKHTRRSRNALAVDISVMKDEWHEVDGS